MKKIIYLLMCVGLLAACSTNQPANENEKETPGGANFYGYCMVSPDRIDVSPRCEFDGMGNTPHPFIYLDLIGYRGPENMDFYTGETTMALIDKMNEQYKAASGKPLYDFGKEVIYASLTEFSITADTELWGVKSGEELSSYFDFIISSAYHNKFPSGDLDESTIGVVIFDIAEYISLGYMCESSMNLVAKSHLDSSELKEGIEFTIKVSFNNGLSSSGTSRY